MDVPFFCVITAFCYVMITKQDAAVHTVCRNLPFSGVEVHLNCSINQWIHVLAETYVNQSSKNCLNTSSTKVCTTVKDNDGHNLDVNCNGKQTCNETYSTDLSKCSTLRAVEITFECIEERINVCGTVNDSMTGPVYMNSPGFPKSVEVEEICSCMISGTSLTVMLIEHRGGTQQFNISSDVGILEKGPRSFNRNIVKRATRVSLTYRGMYSEEFWLSVKGTGNITVICSRESFILPSTSMPTMKTTRTPITSSNTDNTLVTLLVPGAVGVIVLTVIMVVVIICCRRKKSNRIGKNGFDSSKCGSSNKSPRHGGRNNYLAAHNYFELDTAFVTKGPDGAPSSVVADGDFHSRFSLFDNVTFSQDTSMSNGSFDAANGMVINEMYHSYQPANRSNGINVSDEPSQPANQLHSDVEDNDVEEGMVINDLYHSYQ